MVIGGSRADTGVLVSPFWLVAAYMFHTWGELCLSPVGLSYVTKVAPVKFASLLMGVWFLANAAANKVAVPLPPSLRRRVKRRKPNVGNRRTDSIGRRDESWFLYDLRRRRICGGGDHAVVRAAAQAIDGERERVDASTRSSGRPSS